MAIEITCAFCNRRFRVPEDSQGKRIKCPTCHEEVIAEGLRVPDYDIFISHSHKDRQVAYTACAVFEDQGLRCWLAPRNVPSGETWGASIVDAIGNSRFMLVIFSENSNNSQQVLREVERAVSRDTQIVVMRVDKTRLSKDFEYFLGASLWLNARKEPVVEVAGRLADEVCTLLEDPSNGELLPKLSQTRLRRRQSLIRNRLRLASYIVVLATAGGISIPYLYPYVGSLSRMRINWPLDISTIRNESPKSDLPNDAGNPAEETTPESFSDNGQVILSTPEPPKADESKKSEYTFSIGTDGATLALGPTTTMRFVWIAPGKFNMGSTPTEEGREADETFHPVTLTRGYWIASTETTQEQWCAVMGSENNPSTFKGQHRPVEGVSWMACSRFLEKLQQLTGHSFRLPTEAEWEYACRAKANSTMDRISSTQATDESAWYITNSSGQTHPVGLLQSNSFGLYDIQGNVAEFCADRYGRYPSRSVIDPIGPKEGNDFTVRGGSWASSFNDLRPANRESVHSSVASDNLGFRIICLPAELIN